MPAATDATGLPELTFTRVFDAPRELVFKAGWTESLQRFETEITRAVGAADA